ncbi:hypothetical protein LTR40_008111, partial [Exophiala xenobiotica]
CFLLPSSSHTSNKAANTPGNAATNIDNIPPSKPIYVGSDQASGYLRFVHLEARNSGGNDTFRSQTSHNYMSIGPAATLALGLTECCAEHGRGKVYYFCKEWLNGKLVRKEYPESYLQLPDLLYVDFKWTDEARDAWLRGPHWQRLDLLSARAHVLHVNIPTMPIALSYESDDYDEIRFFDNIAQTVLYYNAEGAMYLGFLEDLNQVAIGHSLARGLTWRAQYYVSKDDAGQFKISSGLQAAQQLQSMYQQRRGGKLFLYGTIVSKSIEAHRDWVAAGGYTVEGDPTLGPRIAERIETAQARLDRTTTERGQRLQRLLEETETWPYNVKLALDDYTAAAKGGVVAATRFTISDEGWTALTAVEKNRIVDIYELDEAARERALNADSSVGSQGAEDSDAIA